MHALVANPRRKRRRSARRRTRARRSVRRNPPTRRRRTRRRLRPAGQITLRSRRRGRRKRKTVTRRIYVKNRRRSYRRNPRRSVGDLFSMATLKFAFKPYAIGFSTSMALAVVDKAAANYPAVAGLTKVGVGIVSILAFGRTANAGYAIAALGSSSGYALGQQVSGTLVANTPEEAVEGLGAMYNDYPLQMGALLNGMGVLTGPETVEQGVAAYESALTEDDDDY